MASLAKVQASLVSPELNLSLATCNFDFSLFRVAAPVEYNELGVALSNKRRKVAEEGSSHKTARKLGSLFASTLPKTPRLIKVYGLRTSEISNSSNVNPKRDKTYGAFEEYIGIDGTTIWAAATSGPEAIAVHLLACILARQFPAAEATAIWDELVAERKKHLEESAQAGSFQDAMAASLSVSKEDLFEWDSGARAWLRAADEAEPTKKRQKQLMLILDNISVPVNNEHRVYDSVVRAWTSAMRAMDEMIAGSPYSIQDGAIVLALSAWHIYPDMIVFGENYSKKVDQKDELVHPGGVLTLGLDSKQEEDRGVYWSLALAHLRYYGDPVMSKHCLTSDSARLSMDQLLQVALGSVFRYWGVKMPNVYKAAKLITLMHLCYQNGLPRTSRDRDDNEDVPFHHTQWMTLLGKAASDFLSAADDKELYRRLVGLGLRRGPLLTSKKGTCTGVWRLDTANLVSLMRKEGDMVEFLRELALQCNIDPHSLVIRVRNCGSVAPIADLEISPMDYSEHEVRENSVQYSFMTAVPLNASALSGQKATMPNCRLGRWELIRADQCTTERLDPSTPEALTEMVDLHLEIDAENITTADDDLSFNWAEPPSYYKSSCANLRQTAISVATSVATETCGYDVEMQDIQRFGEDEPSTSSQEYRRKKGRGIDYSSECCSDSRLNFKFLAGDPRTAALYVREGASKVMSFKHTVKLDHIIKCFEDGKIDPCLLRRHLLSIAETKLPLSTSRHILGDTSQTATELAAQREIVRSLHVLSMAADVYHDLPGATISSTIATSGSITLANAKWAQDNSKPRGLKSIVWQELDRELCRFRLSEYVGRNSNPVFACITMFESGVFDFDPDDFKEVMAISSGDSIYVSGQLLRAPTYRSLSEFSVRRVVGNVGRIGLSLLMPPPDPRILSVDPESWKTVTHMEFDGIAKDSFQETSLHLGFSGYSLPKTTGGHRGAYIAASYVETLISVHDRGRWIADLSFMEDPYAYLYVRACSDPDHVCRAERLWDLIPDLVSIDNWDELLDPPNGPAVVRAANNWQACLAATLISKRLGKRAIICELWCQECISTQLTDLARRRMLKGLYPKGDMRIDGVSSDEEKEEEEDDDDDDEDDDDEEDDDEDEDDDDEDDDDDGLNSSSQDGVPWVHDLLFIMLTGPPL
ncbi:hypothetical protein EPUS_08513 [Endocarpon pusillum Z07020]|uniref:Uncharacterized protein n=1 Tax=Endocarpon pusillum (strain Z07020 / HMAS-L-300199) TaxID=1263415 RepID=U1FTI9_ENDPU|nr:uncharacterized protein EPUS_08513 [Endocarpon pusillum Z07020]ERF68077.1 hypothetical protein EPUS_08513 [Endocarpon pusillum Z07020]